MNVGSVIIVGLCLAALTVAGGIAIYLLADDPHRGGDE